MEVLCDELQRASRFRCTTPGQSHERNLKNCTTKCQGLGSAFGVSSPPPALQASVAPPCLWHPALAAAPRSAGGSGLCSAVSMGTSAPRWVWGAGCLWGDVGEGWIPHLLLHPLPLLLDLLLQDFTELLHLLLVLSHASGGGGMSGGSELCHVDVGVGTLHGPPDPQRARSSFPQQGCGRHFGHGVHDCRWSPTPNMGTA